jgi:hypothetical protein
MFDRQIVSTFLDFELLNGRHDLLSSSDVLPLEAFLPFEIPRMTHGLTSICTSYRFKSL